MQRIEKPPERALRRQVQNLQYSCKERISGYEEAMVSLGIGKNMVRSIRFWALAAEVIVPLPKNEGMK